MIKDVYLAHIYMEKLESAELFKQLRVIMSSP